MQGNCYKLLDEERDVGAYNARLAARRAVINIIKSQREMRMVTKCELCKYATEEGFCLAYEKWTLLDIVHDCKKFSRVPQKAEAEHKVKAGINLMNDLKFATDW